MCQLLRLLWVYFIVCHKVVSIEKFTTALWWGTHQKPLMLEAGKQDPVYPQLTSTQLTSVTSSKENKAKPAWPFSSLGNALRLPGKWGDSLLLGTKKERAVKHQGLWSQCQLSHKKAALLTVEWLPELEVREGWRKGKKGLRTQHTPPASDAYECWAVRLYGRCSGWQLELLALSLGGLRMCEKLYPYSKFTEEGWARRANAMGRGLSPKLVFMRVHNYSLIFCLSYSILIKLCLEPW